MGKKSFILLSMTLCLFSIPTFGYDVDTTYITAQANTDIKDILIEEIYSNYPNAINLEFVSNSENLYYFRVFEKKGDMNYKLVEYNTSLTGDLPKLKELIWIWSKDYNSEIRDIHVEKLSANDINAKVYLRNGSIVDESVVFTDILNDFHFVSLDMPLEEVQPN